MPGNRKVVHHVIAIVVKGFDVDPSEGWLGAWAAGTDPMVFPLGTGRFFEKGSNVVADMHSHPTDPEVVDRPRLVKLLLDTKTRRTRHSFFVYGNFA